MLQKMADLDAGPAIGAPLAGMTFHIIIVYIEDVVRAFIITRPAARTF
jgi:hypothetical protein